jgi:hypothetical protein
MLPQGSAIRVVRGIDFERLRLFLLSLLWRATTTRRPEFAEIEMPADHLEQLRQMIAGGPSAPAEFYPVTLIQLSTVGPRHNHTPIADEQPVPNLPGLGSHRTSMFRFYFDGLIARFHRQAEGDISGFRPSVVGATDPLAVSTVPYETSFQRENLEHVLREGRRRP